jgi:hypothetical protein
MTPMAPLMSTLRKAIQRGAGRAAFKWRGWQCEQRFPASASAMLRGFQREDAPSLQAYAELFRYFMTGFAVRSSRHGAHADYAGMGSYNGPAMDRLEGFSRIAPLAAAWLHGGRMQHVVLADGREMDLVAMLKRGVLAGTDPTSVEYWGDIGHWSQAAVEAADIALSLWLTKPRLWDQLPANERARIGRWLAQVHGKRIPDNNWHLFVVQVDRVLAALDLPHDSERCSEHYQRAKSFHRGDGWFRDGERGETPGFDYYNAWGFHYQLQWIRRIDPAWDGDFIDQALREFLATYRYFIGPAGLPMLGRSACYRMAAPVPLIQGLSVSGSPVSAGQARRALDTTWQYFVRRGAVQHGNVTQGYLGADARLLEDYSGPASCLWSLRSLVAAFARPDDDDFWQAAPERLPVERGDYRITIPATGWTVIGRQETAAITIDTGCSGEPALQDFSRIDRWRGAFARLPHRPKNTEAKYMRSRYESSAPFGLDLEPPP